MDYFNYRDHELYAEQVSMQDIVNQVGTPCYIYSKATLTRHWHVFEQSFGDYPHHICYAVKANSNIAILQILAKLGAWFDIVSVGELERVIRAGGLAKQIVFSGVGKREDEINRALDLGIYCFNVESISELQRINAIAKQRNKSARCALRINPDVDAHTHPFISTGRKENKFGIPIDQATELLNSLDEYPYVQMIGIGFHIGSQLLTLKPIVEALDCLLSLVDQCRMRGINFEHIDVGGGLGVCYRDEKPPQPIEYADVLLERLQSYQIPILLEPGRVMVANAGILVTKVEYLKHYHSQHFAIVDCAMNDLMRPALYDAWQNVTPVLINNKNVEYLYDIVGPVCETSDFLAKQRLLAIAENDLLAIRSAGAYGFSMSSQYNSRPRPPEVLVDDTKWHLIRRRETIEDLLQPENLVE